MIDINSCDTISSVKLQDSDFVLEFDGSFMDQKSSLSMSNLTSFQCNHQAVFGKCTFELEGSRMVSDFDLGLKPVAMVTSRTIIHYRGHIVNIFRVNDLDFWIYCKVKHCASEWTDDNVSMIIYHALYMHKLY